MTQNSTLETFVAIVRGIIRMTGSGLASLFHRPTRLSFLQACREYQDVYLRKPLLKRSAPEAIADNRLPIRLEHYIRGKWQVTMLELTVLASFARTRRPANVFEIGTFDGRTTRNLYLNLQDSTIYTIDLPAGVPGSPGGNKPGLLIRDLVDQGEINQIFGNTLDFDFSPWHGTQDLVFVDAGHSYRNALADSKTALRLVEGREAVVIWHDYAVMPGVTRAVEEIVPLVSSEVEFQWIEGTSLAVMSAKPGHPITLSGELASKNAGLASSVADSQADGAVQAVGAN